MPSELEGFIFPYFLAENRILGCLGSILEASWAVLAKFLVRLGRQVGAMLRSKTPPRRPRTPPGRALGAPRGRQDIPRGPKRSQEAPRRLQDRFLVDFYWFFNWFL